MTAPGTAPTTTRRVLEALAVALVTGIATAVLRPLERGDVRDGAAAIVGWLGGDAGMSRWFAGLLGTLAAVGTAFLLHARMARLRAQRREPAPPKHASLGRVEFKGILWLVTWRPGPDARAEYARPLCPKCNTETVEDAARTGPNGMKRTMVLRCRSCGDQQQILGFENLNALRDAAIREAERRGREADAGR